MGRRNLPNAVYLDILNSDESHTEIAKKHGVTAKWVGAYRRKHRPNKKYKHARRGTSFSEEHKQKLSKSHIGHERCAKMWRVTHPDGRVETIRNLEKFCREHGFVTSSNLAQRGKSKGYKAKRLLRK
jgi:hypothetical protein